MATVELCTAGTAGPYLLAPDTLADDLQQRFEQTGIPCVVELGALRDGPVSRCVIAFGVGANLAAISRLLNEIGCDWSLAGWD